MSVFHKMLFEESVRREMGDSPGLKTPVSVEFEINSDMEDLIVSTTRGDFLHIDNNKNRSNFKTNLFECEPQEEDRVQSDLAVTIFETSVEEEWGNAVRWPSVTEANLEGVKSYFDSFDLPVAHLFTGFKGLQALHDSGVFSFKDPDQEIEGEISEESISELMGENKRFGNVSIPDEDVPVYFNPHLGGLFLWTTKSNFLGEVLRIHDYMSIALHNPVRGTFLALLDED